MRFGEYFWKLLTRPFKMDDDGSLRTWVDAVGTQLDKVKLSVFKMRRSWVIQTATGEALDLIGRSRKLPRYPGESDEAYRRRLSAAWEIYRRGGTIPGMKEALRLIGYPDAEIHELYKDGPVSPFHNGAYTYNGTVRHSGGVRWAEFRVRTRIEDGRDLTRTDMAVLLDTIYRVKPARSMPTALALDIMFEDFVPHQDGIELDVIFVAHALREQYPWEGHLHDGSATHSGAITYDSTWDVSAVSADLVLEDEQQTGGVIHNAWFRRDGQIRFGAHPSILDTGGAAAVPRFRETLESADAPGEFGAGLRASDQFPDGPTLHDGVPRQSVRRYGQDRVQDEHGQGLRLNVTDTPPGAATYGWGLLRYDGGGPAWRHNGRIGRAPRYTHSGQIDHSGVATRWRALHRYGDRARMHNGLERHGRTIPRDGSWTRGANGPVELFDVVVKRHGRPVVA